MAEERTLLQTPCFTAKLLSTPRDPRRGRAVRVGADGQTGSSSVRCICPTSLSVPYGQRCGAKRSRAERTINIVHSRDVLHYRNKPRYLRFAPDSCVLAHQAFHGGRVTDLANSAVLFSAHRGEAADSNRTSNQNETARRHDSFLGQVGQIKCCSRRTAWCKAYSKDKRLSWRLRLVHD